MSHFQDFVLHRIAAYAEAGYPPADATAQAAASLLIERAWAEKDGNLGDWCWVAPGSEARMKAAIEAALRK